MLRAFLAMLALTGLVACGADQTFAPQPEVDAARFVAGPPTYITLYTVINDRNGSGAHSGLLINGSERILFDPAGTWYHPAVPIQHDVHYGMNDAMVAFYLDYHARDNATEKFHVVERTVLVSPQVAEIALQKVKAYGSPALRAGVREPASQLVPDRAGRGLRRIARCHHPDRDRSERQPRPA